jgi:flagellar motor switch protein FliG
MNTDKQLASLVQSATEATPDEATPDFKDPGLNAVKEDDAETLSGAQKAAVLLIALGVDAAGEVLRRLDDHEVEQISIEIARLRNVSSEVVESVLEEYHDMAIAQDYIAQGGMAFAREALVEALGSDRAEEVLMRVEASMEVSAFHLLQTVETDQLSGFLRKEHPQTAALILSHLNPVKSGDIINRFDDELQEEILYRLATMNKTSPDMLNDIEAVIRQQLGSVFGAELSSSGGAEKVADILNGINRNTEKKILGAMEKRDPELAENIKRLMFVFEDLVNVHDRDLQRLLTEVDQQDLVYALKAAPEELKDKILNNVSQRVANGIREELELMGRVRVGDVEDAQRAIIETAQRLEDNEEIMLTTNPEEMIG